MNEAARVFTWRDWHVPLGEGRMTLREALDSLHRLGEKQESIPLIVKLLENPRFHIPGITLFHGAVDLHHHDCIHILLGRGLLPKDEAFAIGFTMGSTRDVSTSEERIFAWVARTLYPRVYRFGEEEVRVFRDAVHIGMVTGCQRLDRVEFDPWMDRPLGVMREDLGIECGLLRACYDIERRRYPEAPESRRLLDERAPDPVRPRAT